MNNGTLALVRPRDEFRLPPQNIEAEESVLGSVLLDNDQLHVVASILRAEDFYRDTHQTIFEAILDLYGDGKAVDAITVADELTRRGQFESVGGDETLARLLNRPPHSANAKYHAQIVRQKAVSRALIDAANAMLQEGYSNNFTAPELLNAAESRVFAIAESEVHGDVVKVADAMIETMKRINIRRHKRAPDGLTSGLFELDDLVGGWRPEMLVIVGARPSMGKTSLGMDFIRHAAIDQKKSVLFVSLEMGRHELNERLLCSQSRVDGHKLRTGQNIGVREEQQLAKAQADICLARIFIDDTAARNMLQIMATARRLKLQHGLDLIIVDYIQLVDAEETRDSRQEQIAKISRRLKTLAREVKVPVIALSQLNRQAEQREDRRPRMADLRESGAIEQDADVALLLHRPEYYDPNDAPGIAEINVAKNRNGPTGTVRTTFLKNIMAFENLATVVPPMDPNRPY